MAKMTIYILPTKTRGCAPQSPETDENDENDGCPSGKTRVCQKQGFLRSHPSKPNQIKGQNEKFMNFAHFCEFWCFSLGKQARFTLNFCSGMPLRKVHELTFLWFGLPGPLLIFATLTMVFMCFLGSITGVPGTSSHRLH